MSTFIALHGDSKTARLIKNCGDPNAVQKDRDLVRMLGRLWVLFALLSTHMDFAAMVYYNKFLVDLRSGDPLSTASTWLSFADLARGLATLTAFLAAIFLVARVLCRRVLMREQSEWAAALESGHVVQVHPEWQAAFRRRAEKDGLPLTVAGETTAATVARYLTLDHAGVLYLLREIVACLDDPHLQGPARLELIAFLHTSGDAAAQISHLRWKIVEKPLIEAATQEADARRALASTQALALVRSTFVA